ncbi:MULTISPECIES: HD domain-containing protein [Methylorubrum]|uniref:HD domain-containing protein n=1 Tax=Methylorubrum TaxID=2282523 RepID=UPI00209D6429|nr:MULTISPECIES: HD domain-containing protein [Methylorubrum]MCP1549081.1 putative hydrolase of HD superfamily [Methylorubrum zatmanii]MCP1554306.1 putative hydrolase of HD superfamily [Methylorubrum extorquens]MCP1579383.1 putative hydrolase of HD superfamily [Methylorubrum extorquens]
MDDATDIASRFAFLSEIDGLKAVLRQNRTISERRRENSAEHSWHLAMFALVLGDLAPGLDLNRVVAMLLVHDIVEVDAGDVPIHSAYDSVALARVEAVAAERIFGLLPEPQRDRFLGLWREFEAVETVEARFAKALDRLQPLLLNTLTEGGTWAENGLTEAQVMARYRPVIERGIPGLWPFVEALVRRHYQGHDTTA